MKQNSILILIMLPFLLYGIMGRILQNEVEKKMKSKTGNSNETK